MNDGMKQRVVGTIAKSGEPGVIIADEPTMVFDVTIRLQYLRLLKEIQSEAGLGIIFITHDFRRDSSDVRPCCCDVRRPHRGERPCAR